MKGCFSTGASTNPVGRRRGQAQSGFVVGLLLILMAATGFVLFLVGSSYGASLLLRIGLTLAGSGEASGVEGSLYRGLSIAELRYEGNGLGVAAEGIRIDVDWLALRQREVRLIEASVAKLELDLPAAEPSTEPFAMPAVPSWPELPVTVRIGRLALGGLTLRQGGEPVPVELQRLALRAEADERQARVELLELEVQAAEAGLTAHGDLVMRPAAEAGAAPELDLRLALRVRQGNDIADASLHASGALDQLSLDAVAQGYELDVTVQAELAPFSATLPLHALRGQVRGLRPEMWVASLPPGKLDLDLDLAFEGELWPAGQIGAFNPDTLRTRLALTVEPDSRWQGRQLSGQVNLRQDGWRLPEARIALRVGDNRIDLDGAAGSADDVLRYRVQVPAPGQLWPGLTGQADLAGEVRGLPERHGLTLKGSLTLPPGLLPQPASEGMQVSIEGGQLVESEPSPLDEAIDLPAVLAEGPYRFDVVLEGGWGPGGAEAWQAGRLGWRGRIARLAIQNPQVGLQLLDPLAVDIAVPAEQRPLTWQLGATRLQLALPYQRRVVLVHRGSDGNGEHWRSAGRIDDLVPAWLVAQLPRSNDPLRLDLAWDLARAASLTGQVQLRRRAGDIEIPGEQSLALGLQTLQVDLRAEATGPGASTLHLEANVAGKQLGRLALEGSTRMVLSGGVPMVMEQEPVRLDARLALDDLSWLMAFTGDETEVGGRLNGEVRLERTRGEWLATGSLQGDQLRVVRIDEGVRLLNGSLRARFTQDRVEIESLRFPSEIRTVPRNSAVQAWVSQYGKEGVIEASGSWSLADASGEANVRVSRFPLVQRVDRFVAGSGDIRIEASPRRLDISGKVVADIGWANIEGTDELPSLASDVVIVRDGKPVEASTALPLRLNLEVDLGQHMTLTGLGLNTGLTGTLQIRNGASGLRGTGVINTRDGRFSIYGQTLVVRQGAITFQGPIDDPLLDIVAVRPNLQIEAGVQIIGTARRPEITLVSFPDVPEVEKLSWLLLGRGPDARGADAGLLLSAAASLLGDGDGEPIYRQFGLDELGLRSGMGSSVQGLLPSRTVIGSITSSDVDNEAGQFLVAGKRLSEALYLTFEQALSGHEAVVRLSYRVSERLSLSLQGGTINGLRLMWSMLW